MSKAIALVIDDEADLIELVRYNLEREGYTVLGAADGESGFARAVSEKPDVIVMDLMLPGIDGLEVCRMLRAESATSRIPIIMLTAKASESDRVVGLELGADDYMTKPFSPRELTARIKALLRRSLGYHQQPAIMRHGNLFIDPSSHEVRCGNKTIDLTATEYRLLQFLASHPGYV
jgi:two-component system, OmpR family, alkaline phosphatase synthesis response regulator PhoP